MSFMLNSEENKSPKSEEGSPRGSEHQYPKDTRSSTRKIGWELKDLESETNSSFKWNTGDSASNKDDRPIIVNSVNSSNTTGTSDMTPTKENNNDIKQTVKKEMRLMDVKEKIGFSDSSCLNVLQTCVNESSTLCHCKNHPTRSSPDLEKKPNNINLRGYETAPNLSSIYGKDPESDISSTAKSKDVSDFYTSNGSYLPTESESDVFPICRCKHNFDNGQVQKLHVPSTTTYRQKVQEISVPKEETKSRYHHPHYQKTVTKKRIGKLKNLICRRKTGSSSKKNVFHHHKQKPRKHSDNTDDANTVDQDGPWSETVPDNRENNVCTCLHSTKRPKSGSTLPELYAAKVRGGGTQSAPQQFVFNVVKYPTHPGQPHYEPDSENSYAAKKHKPLVISDERNEDYPARHAEHKPTNEVYDKKIRRAHFQPSPLSKPFLRNKKFGDIHETNEFWESYSPRGHAPVQDNHKHTKSKMDNDRNHHVNGKTGSPRFENYENDNCQYRRQFPENKQLMTSNTSSRFDARVSGHMRGGAEYDGNDNHQYGHHHYHQEKPFVKSKYDGDGQHYDNQDAYMVAQQRPERIEVYYFDHGCSGYFRTTDYSPSIATESMAEKVTYTATKFWAEIFGLLHIISTFFIAFLLQLLRCIFYSIVRPLVVGTVQITSDYFFKPFLAIIFNGILQPIFIFLFNIMSSVRDVCEVVAQAIGYFLQEIANVCRSIRLIDVKNNTRNGPFFTPNNKNGVDV